MYSLWTQREILWTKIESIVALVATKQNSVRHWQAREDELRRGPQSESQWAQISFAKKLKKIKQEEIRQTERELAQLQEELEQIQRLLDIQEVQDQ